MTSTLGGKPKHLKQENSRAVFEWLRSGHSMTVGEVGEHIQLSKTTIKKIFDALVSAQLIRMTGKGASTEEGGKRPDLYELNQSYGYVIGIHAMPDAILCVTTDLSGSIRSRHVFAVNNAKQLDGAIEHFAELIEHISIEKQDTGERLLGIALVLTGLVDPAAGVSIHSSFYPEWGNNAPIATKLRKRLGDAFQAPIFIDNTNRFQAIAESRLGLAGRSRNFVVIDALPEGVGGGVVVNQQMLHGQQNLSGEIGHMTLDPRNGFPCICGHRGCFEAMVSEKRILGLAGEWSARFPESAITGQIVKGVITLDNICEEAADGDALCRALIDDVAAWYVQGCGNLVMMNDPELIVLQGIYNKAGTYFLERIRQGLQHIGMPGVEKKVQVAFSELGEDRGVLGGALHVIDCYLDQYFRQ